MGLFDLFKKDSKNESVSKNIQICGCTNGKFVKLAELGDGVFSEGILGQGFAIEPKDGTIYSPADAVVINTVDSKHAIGMLINDSVELLIHVGLDTVMLNGEGFELLVSEGQKVKKGEPILKADLNFIANSGYKYTVVNVFTNVPENADIKIYDNLSDVNTNDILTEITLK